MSKKIFTKYKNLIRLSWGK